MQYKLEDLPYEKFKLIGLDKKQVLSLPTTTLKNLLDGRNTDLIEFSYNNKLTNKPTKFQGKLSLKTINNNIELVLHPVTKKIKNDFGLTDAEINKLRDSKGVEFIEKTIVKNGREPQLAFIYLDKDINKLIAIDPNTIASPLLINGSELTEKQKSDFKKGKEIIIGNERFLFNPTNELGISDNNENINKIKNFKAANYAYDSNALIVDIALLASGLGTVFLLGHMLRYTSMKIQEYRMNREEYTPAAFRKFENEIKEELKKDIQEKKENITEAKENKGVEISGKLVNYGTAPYKNEKDQHNSFFIEMETSEGRITKIWSKELHRSLTEAEIQKGQNIKLTNKGTTEVTVKIPIKDKEGHITSYRETEALKSYWEIKPFKNITHKEDVAQERDTKKKRLPKIKL